MIVYFKYFFITKDLKITLFQIFTAWYTYKIQRLKCSLYWSRSQSESKNCVYVKTVLGTAAMSHCKSDLLDFSVCMAVYGLQQFSSTDTMVLAQSEYSSLPEISGDSIQMHLYSFKFHMFVYHSPSEALIKDAISSGMVPSSPKGQIIC